MKKGDTVYFPHVSFLVNEAVVEDIQDNCVIVKTRVPGVTHLLKNQVFETREELRESEAYHRAWMQKHLRESRRYQSSFNPW